MATNLNIDEKLLVEAQRLSGKTKCETVNEALSEYVARHKRKQILTFFGKVDIDPNYDHKKDRQR